jgi:hypothetical protein
MGVRGVKMTKTSQGLQNLYTFFWHVEIGHADISLFWPGLFRPSASPESHQSSLPFQHTRSAHLQIFRGVLPTGVWLFYRIIQPH